MNQKTHHLRSDMEKLTIYLSPMELAYVRNVPLSEIFEEIRQKTIPYVLTDDGIEIPVTYTFE